MVFGFNNFNMMNMFPMNFGSFGFGSFGCGTGYSNFGSSLFGCGFGNNYLNPVNCNGSTNWGAVGFGLTTAFAPVLFAGVTRLVSGAVQNSNGNQQEVVTDDIAELQAQKEAILKEAGVEESVLLSYTKDSNSEAKTALTAAESKLSTATTQYTNALKKYNDNQNIIDEYERGKTDTEKRISKLKSNTNKTEAENTELNNLLKKQKDYNTAINSKAQLERVKNEAETAKNNAQEAVKNAEKELKAYNKKMLEAKAKLEEKNNQIKKAQAELDKLVLDKADGTKASRTRAEEFNKLITEKGGKLTFNTDKNIDDVKKGDLQYILAQFGSAKDKATKQKWGNLFKEIYNNTQLDGDLRTGTMEKAYDLVDEFLEKNLIQ